MNAEKLKELRTKAGFTQEELAKKLNITRKTINSYENGSSIPDHLEIILNKILNHDDSSVTLGYITGFYLPEVSASAGLETSINNDELKKIPVTIPGWEKDIIFINVFGDSMYPKFNSGEVIGVKYVEFQYLNYGYPYVVVFNNGEVIKITADFYTHKHNFLDKIDEMHESAKVVPISSENPAKILANHKSDKMTGVYAIGRSKRKNEALKKINFG